MSVDGRFGPVARLTRRGRAFAPVATADGNARSIAARADA